MGESITEAGGWRQAAVGSVLFEPDDNWRLSLLGSAEGEPARVQVSSGPAGFAGQALWLPPLVLHARLRTVPCQLLRCR